MSTDPKDLEHLVKHLKPQPGGHLVSVSREEIKRILDERSPFPPWEHQLDGVHHMAQLLNLETGRLCPGCSALFDEMGAGKTKQAADLAQLLHHLGHLDCAIVVCPSSVRTVWAHPEYGEIRKHLWKGGDALVAEFHGSGQRWATDWNKPGILTWIVTNFEHVRNEQNREELLKFCGKRTILFVDESSAVKNFTAAQTKAVIEIREHCGRVVLMNGTPVSNSIGDLFAQMFILDPRILRCTSYHHFKSKYAVMGGWQNKQVMEWRNVEDIQTRIAPYAIRRLKKDCLDLPAKLPSVAIPVALTKKTWELYKEMRAEAVAWLTENVTASPAQAGVRVMRLAQITSGFLGGLEEEAPCLPCEGTGFIGEDVCLNCGGGCLVRRQTDPRVFSHEKIDALRAWHSDLLSSNPHAKVIVWCRFRSDVDRVLGALSNIAQGALYGGQKREERQRTLWLLDPRNTFEGPAVAAAIPASGSVGLNLAGASYTLWFSHGNSLKDKLQADDRVDREGQKQETWYGDLVATGPDGQHTVDHTIIKRLQKKEEIAVWTCSTWVKALREEEEQ